MDRRHLTAAAACAGVLALALDGGGYERSAWGWAGLAAWALVLVALVRGERLPAGRAALVFGVGLLAVLGWTLATAAWSQSLPSSVAEAQRVLVYAGAAWAALLFVRRDTAAWALGGVVAAAALVALWNLVARAGDGGGTLGAGGEPLGYVNGVAALAACGLAAVVPALPRLRGTLLAGALAAALPCAAVLALAGSAGALLALGAGLAVAAALGGSRVLGAAVAAAVVVAAAIAVADGRAAWEVRERYWGVALGAAADAPVAGTGAGTFGQRWLAEREVPLDALDAHSLYVEALAEQGTIGLALLLAALAAPLVAGARRLSGTAPLGLVAPAAAGAYVTFLVHAGVDWDWEQPAVVVPGVLAAAALLAAAGALEHRMSRGARGLAALGAAGAAAAALTLVSGIALERGDQHVSVRLEPWASEPRLALAREQRRARDVAGAREALREALDRDPRRWVLWFELAELAMGQERERALERARSLNPLGPAP